jgi:hypothetical protein
MKLTAAQLKKYLPVNTLKDVDIMDTHQARAWNKHLPKYIGRDLMQLADGQSPPPVLIAVLEPVLANFALVEAIPFLDLVLTSTGFGIVSNDNIAPASADRVKSLARAAATAATDAMDQLLYEIETTDDLADLWNKSCIIQGSLLRNTNEFQQQIDINESRTRFFAIKQAIDLYERKRIVNMVGTRQINELLRKRTDKTVLPLLRKALAYYALTQDDVRNHDTADEYMRQALRHMIDNPTLYPLYHTDMMETRHQNDETSGFMILG